MPHLPTEPPPGPDSPAGAPGSERAREPVEIRLVIPADVRYLRLARLVVAGLAADADRTVDEIDDLRVAVDEVGSLLIDAGGDDTVEFVFHDWPDRLVVTATRARPDRLPDVHPVSRGLLDATTDGFELRHDGHRAEVTARRLFTPGA